MSADDALVAYLAAELERHRPAHGGRRFCTCGATLAPTATTWAQHRVRALLDALDRLAQDET